MKDILPSKSLWGHGFRLLFAERRVAALLRMARAIPLIQLEQCPFYRGRFSPPACPFSTSVGDGEVAEIEPIHAAAGGTGLS